jgi:hypothetical protein
MLPTWTKKAASKERTMRRRDVNWPKKLADLERIFRAKNTGRIAPQDETGQLEASRRYDWISRLPQDKTSNSRMTVELLVETRGGAAQLVRFVHQLDEIIHEGADYYGGILRTASLLDGITSITIMLEPGRLGELMISIAVLPEVEKVEDAVYDGQNSFSSDGWVGAPRYPINTFSPDRIRVVMKKDIVTGY